MVHIDQAHKASLLTTTGLGTRANEIDVELEAEWTTHAYRGLADQERTH